MNQRALLIALGFAAASQASAGIVYTGLERSAQAGGLGSNSSELFTVFNANHDYQEDTGGLFIEASADAIQNSQLSDISQTLAFDGSVGASGGSVSGASASTELLLSFVVEAGSTLELAINGFVQGSSGGGIDPGSTGGIGSATFQINRGGNVYYSRATSDGTVNIDQDLTLDPGGYELLISLSAGGPPQVGGGSASADFAIQFTTIPAPSSAMLLCAAGVLASRRRRA